MTSQPRGVPLLHTVPPKPGKWCRDSMTGKRHRVLTITTTRIVDRVVRLVDPPPF